MALPRVLLVDDNTDFLKIATEFLKLKGYEVVAVTDLTEGRRLLEHDSFTVAFIDINFDPSDDLNKRGLELAIQTIETSSVPKVIMTVYSNPENTREALMPRRGKTGAAVDFLDKAGGLSQMLETIERIVLRARVFLSYARPDQDAVIDLYNRLQMSSFLPWMDKKDLEGGEDWETAVRSVMSETDFVVVCLSNASVDRRGYFQTEIKMALKIHEEQPTGKIFLIPLRFEKCEVNDPRLMALHRIDFFEPDGYDRLMRSLREGISRRANKT